MKKLFIIVCCIVVISGCDLFKREIIRTEVVQLRIPMLYCPAPDKRLLERPDLPIHSLTQEERQQYDKLVKSYVATIKTLQDYSSRLELSLNQYEKISKAYADMRKQFMADWNELRAKILKLNPQDVNSFTKGVPIDLINEK